MVNKSIANTPLSADDVVDICLYGEVTGFDPRDPDSAADIQVKDRLVLLNANGELLLGNDTEPLTGIVGSTPLAFVAGELSSNDDASSSEDVINPQVAPKWEKIAFNGQSMYGCENGFLWTLSIDLDNGTYTVGNR